MVNLNPKKCLTIKELLNSKRLALLYFQIRYICPLAITVAIKNQRSFDPLKWRRIAVKAGQEYKAGSDLEPGVAKTGSCPTHALPGYTK